MDENVDKLLMESLKLAYFESFPSDDNKEWDTSLARFLTARNTNEMIEAAGFPASIASDKKRAILDSRHQYALHCGHLLGRAQIDSNTRGEEAEWTLWEQSLNLLMATSHHCTDELQSLTSNIPPMNEEKVNDFLNIHLGVESGRMDQLNERLERLLQAKRTKKQSPSNNNGITEGNNAKTNEFVSASKFGNSINANNGGSKRFFQKRRTDPAIEMEEEENYESKENAPSNGNHISNNNNSNNESLPIHSTFAYYNLGVKPTTSSGGLTSAISKRPVMTKQKKAEENSNSSNNNNSNNNANNNNNANQQVPASLGGDERLAGLDSKLVEAICNEMIQKAERVDWSDIVGLEHAKNSIIETVILPLQRPDLFTGIRQPVKGMLLFGPPGTGKTMLGKCIASQANATFFCISASSITSKWVGESEKLVRALFAVARSRQPSVIFIDEVDSVLTQRTDGEVEATRRIKTEFLVQFDGAATCSEDHLLFIGATNRPQELDEAVRRRLVKRLYIPLPSKEARKSMVRQLMTKNRHCLTESDLETIAYFTEGYSGSDMRALCAEAAMGPMRSITTAVLLQSTREDQLRCIDVNDFHQGASQIRASVSDKDLQAYQEWNRIYGTLDPGSTIS